MQLDVREKQEMPHQKKPYVIIIYIQYFFYLENKKESDDNYLESTQNNSIGKQRQNKNIEKSIIVLHVSMVTC